MMGNYHVRFLGGKGAVTPLTYPVGFKEYMDNLKRAIRLLDEIIENPEMLQSNISKFQHIVWHESNHDNKSESKYWSSLGDLAYDLEYYEPNPEWRKEDLSYYGDERAIEEIRSFRIKLQKEYGL